MRQKAAERNPDEFHFAMISSKTRDGGQKVADRGNQALSQDAVRLLKTQDAGYLRTMAQKTRISLQQAEQAVVSGDSTFFTHSTGNTSQTKSPRHIAFVDTKADQGTWASSDERRQESHAPAKSPPKSERDHKEDSVVDDADGINEAFPSIEKLRIDTVSEQPLSHEAVLARKQRKREHEKKRKTLEALRRRATDIRAAELELEVQRARMNHSIGALNTRTGTRFKIRERKR